MHSADARNVLPWSAALDSAVRSRRGGPVPRRSWSETVARPFRY